MPRYARKEILSKLIHVMIQGINKEYIFNNDIEIRVYLRYLREKIKDTNVKVLAYCMMNNHAHFLMYYEDIKDVSKLMCQVNTKYAMFYNKKNNRCGVVFRNRYQLEEIKTRSHLITCINYIHNNPVKAGMCDSARSYPYSSYDEYKKHGKGALLDWKFIDENLHKFSITINSILRQDECDELFIFMEDDMNRAKEEFKENILKKYMQEKSIIQKQDIVDNKRYLKEIVLMMHYKYQVKKEDISKALGLNRMKIYRIIEEFEK